MADIAFENISAQIAAGTITAKEIEDYSCDFLSDNEKEALLTALAFKLVEEKTPLVQSGTLSGIVRGEDSLEIPAFLSGKIQVVDTDNSATDDLTGDHQFVLDTLGDSFPEASSMEWSFVPGQYYPSRVLDVPEGTLVLYTFVIKN